jgi:hypothetical protein
MSAKSGRIYREAPQKRRNNAEKTLEWLEQKAIKIVHKADSPPNVPQARPVENFWALLARAVYAKGWKAKNKAELSGRIKRKLKEIDVEVVQTMMRGVRTKLRETADNVPLLVM